MEDQLNLLELPAEQSPETLYVQRLKEAVAGRGNEKKGDKLSFTMKMARNQHGALLAACARHGITITDLLTMHVEQILPVLQKARVVDVPGLKRDLRTTPARRHG